MAHLAAVVVSFWLALLVQDHCVASFPLTCSSPLRIPTSPKGQAVQHSHLSRAGALNIAMASKNLVKVSKTPADVSMALGAYIAEHSAAAVKAKGRFSIGFSGGSLPKLACGDIVSDASIAWDKWDIFFVDERCVALDHADSNYKCLKENMLDKLSTPIPAENVVAYDPSSSSPEDAAQRYADAVIAKVPVAEGSALPSFDLLLLGVGEDGHTASLFPGHALLEEKEKIVAHIMDSPKPPPERITLTYPVIAAAKEVAVVAAGAGKAGLLSEILGKGHEGPTFPIERACDKSGSKKWFIDEAAAALLDSGSITTF